MTFPPVQYTDL